MLCCAVLSKSVGSIQYELQHETSGHSEQAPLTGAAQVLNGSYTTAIQALHRAVSCQCQVAPRYLDASGSRAASKPNHTAKKRSQPAAAQLRQG